LWGGAGEITEGRDKGNELKGEQFMHCPNRSKQIAPGQKFCRFCGRELSAVPEVMAQPPSAPDSDNQMAKVTARMAERRMNRTLFWGLIVIGVGLTLLANAQGHRLLDWTGVSIFLAGMGLAIYGAFSPPKAKELLPGEPAQPKTLNQSEANSYLPPKDFSEPVLSVTERTTELLEVEKTRAPR
jgi:hypothetical protein